MPTNATAHQLWSKIIRFGQSTLNTSRDGADIGDSELQSCSNFIFDHGVLEKAGGLTKVNSSPLESGAPIMSVFRSHDTYGNKTLLASCNGKLKRWSDPNFVDVQTGMTVGERIDFLNWDNDTVIVNGKEEALAFTPRTNGIRKFGLEPPRFYKKVAYFESDEIITHDSGGTTDTVFIKTTERTGKSKTSLKITAAAGETKVSYVTYSSSQNFSIFPNGASISTNDMICIDILHRTAAYVNELYVDFWTSTGAFYRLTINGSELDPDLRRDNKWTHITAKKSRFVATGTPSWNNINRVYFSVKAQTGTAIVYFDNVYFKNTPIETRTYGRTIDNFEAAGTPGGGGAGDVDWYIVDTLGTLAYESVPLFVREGTRSLKLTFNQPTACCQIEKTFSPTVNYNLYNDGNVSPASDEIVFWIYGTVSRTTSGYAYVAIIFSGATGQLTHTFAAVGAGGDDYMKVSTGNLWTEYRLKKSAFTGTQSNWTSIQQIDITVSGIVVATPAIVYLDKFNVEQNQYIRNLATMESTETWTFSGIGGFSTDETKLVAGSSSIYLNAQKAQTASAIIDVATQNLTYFGVATEISTTEDLIGFWLYWTYFQYIDSIKLQIDCNTGDFVTDYFEYEWSKASIMNALTLTDEEISLADASSLNNRSMDLFIKKSLFYRFGSTGGKGWNTVEKYKFIIRASSNADYPLIVYFDNLTMKRGTGISGLYQWCCVFESPEAFSAPSEFSDIVDFKGTSALLSNIPISSDTNIMARHIFRKGGTLGDDARLDFTLYDNTTTTYTTSNIDEALGRRLNEIDIPQGTIRIPLAAKWGPIFKGSAILYRDPEDFKRIWFSNPKYFYAWSELQLMIMDSDVQDIFLDDGVLHVSCKNGMRRISVPLDEVGPTDIGEMGSSKPSISPFASVKAEQFRVIIAYDGVYAFNGQTFVLMSKNIDNYFNELVYHLDEAIVFYIDQHLYISVKTLAGVRTLLDAFGPLVQWRTSTEDINCFCVFDGIGDNGEIYIGDSTGTVYKFNSGYETLAQVITKDFGAEGEESDPFNDIILTECHVIVKSLSESGGQLQIQFRKDQAIDVGVTLILPVTGNLPNVYTVYSKMLRGEYNEIRGNKIGAILTHNLANKHCAIQAIKLVGEITPLIIAYE